MPTKRWTDAQTEQAKMLAAQGHTTKQAAFIMGIKPTRLWPRAQALGIRFRGSVRWTPNMVNALRRYASEGRSQQEVADLMNLPWRQVHSASCRFGINWRHRRMMARRQSVITQPMQETPSYV